MGKRQKKLMVSPVRVSPLEQLIKGVEETDINSMNLLTDINEEFFAFANKIIQTLMESQLTCEASVLYRYVYILERLHMKYAKEVALSTGMATKIKDAEEKLSLALEATAVSDEMMKHIQDSLDDAWRTVDSAEYRVQNLQQKLVGQKSIELSFANVEEEQLDENLGFGFTLKSRNIILRERDRLNAEVHELQQRLEMQRYYAENLEFKLKGYEESFNKVVIRIKVLQNDMFRLEAKKIALQVKVDDHKEEILKLNQTVNDAGVEIKTLKSAYASIIKEYDQIKFSHDRLAKDREHQVKTMYRLEEDRNHLKLTLHLNIDLLRSEKAENREKCAHIQRLIERVRGFQQENTILLSKFAQMNRDRLALHTDISQMKNVELSLNKRLEIAALKLEDMRGLRDAALRERDKLATSLMTMTNKMNEMRHEVQLKINTIHDQKLEVRKLIIKFDEVKNANMKAMEERSGLNNELNIISHQLDYYKEDLELTMRKLKDANENIVIQHTEILQAKKNYEILHSEKIIIQKQLESCRLDRDSLRSLQTKTTYELQQLYNKTAFSEKEIVQLNVSIDRLNSENKAIQSEVKNMENSLNSTRKDLKDVKARNDQLTKLIADDDLKFLKISTDLSDVRNEKNLVGLQLVRRNDELCLLKEKLKIVQSGLDRGKSDYNNRLNDIRLLKVEIFNLRTERDCLVRRLKTAVLNKREVIRLQRLVNQNEIKMSALTEELRKPCTVHHWRILKGNNMSKFELHMKVQRLLKINIRNDAKYKNLQIKYTELQRTYEAIKHTLENQAGDVIKRKLVVQQRVNRRLDRQVKALKAELAIDEIDLKAHECVISGYQATIRSAHFQKQGTKPCHSHSSTGGCFMGNKAVLKTILDQCECAKEVHQKCVYDRSVVSSSQECIMVKTVYKNVDI